MKALPWFPFSPSDWLASQQIAMMTPEQEGAYIRLLAHAWNGSDDCTLPNDDKVLAVLSRLNSRWSKCGAEVKECFEVEGERIYNQRQRAEFMRAMELHAKRSEGGAKTAKRRWGKSCANS